MKKDNPTKAIKDIKGKNLRKLEETESIAVIDYPSNTVEEFSTYLDVQLLNQMVNLHQKKMMIIIIIQQ